MRFSLFLIQTTQQIRFIPAKLTKQIARKCQYVKRDLSNQFIVLYRVRLTREVAFSLPLIGFSLWACAGSFFLSYQFFRTLVVHLHASLASLCWYSWLLFIIHQVYMLLEWIIRVWSIVFWVRSAESGVIRWPWWSRRYLCL